MGCCFSSQKRESRSNKRFRSNRRNEDFNQYSQVSSRVSSFNTPQISNYIQSQPRPSTTHLNQNTNKLNYEKTVIVKPTVATNPDCFPHQQASTTSGYHFNQTNYSSSQVKDALATRLGVSDLNNKPRVYETVKTTPIICTNEAPSLKNKNNEVSKYYETLNQDVLNKKPESDEFNKSGLSSKGLTEETPWILDDAQSVYSAEFEQTDINLIIHGLPCTIWTDEEYVSENADIDYKVAKSIIQLFKEDNTIPFITRYRKNITGGMEAEELRAVKEVYERSQTIRKKAAKILRIIDSQGKWNYEIHEIIESCKSLNDLEHIYSMFKPPSKRSLLKKARENGLQPVADAVLQGQRIMDLSAYIDPKREGLKSLKEINNGLIHIIADVISKDKTLFEKIQQLRKSKTFEIEVSEGKAAQDLKVEEGVQQNADVIKWKKYFNFKCTESRIKDHEILAINRGEAQKFLSVKILIPNSFEQNLKKHVFHLYGNGMFLYTTLITDGFNFSYKNRIKPAIIQKFRKEIKDKAELASTEVFATNVKQLLLTPPLRGKPVLGIDPGFLHGCKLAVVSQNGDVLKTAKIYLLPQDGRFKKAENILASLVRTYNCTTIALGNGTASRETELFLGNLIKNGTFAPLEVSYTIVNEAGVSIYSCSEEAKKEFKHLDPTLISAVSMARRLQDPLAELVKIEPKHLGVGMYQHDVPEKLLDTALNQVVTEAVSFVGVDINTTSLCLLKKIAGLDATKAKNILDWRKENGNFLNREQLLDVKGIDNKTYEQCAGFIRILPKTALVAENFSALKKPLNYLDQTWIHPESYNIAMKIIMWCNCSVNNLGTESFISTVAANMNQRFSSLAKIFKTNEAEIEIIVKGLTISLKEYDIRLMRDKPLFRQSVTEFDNLVPGVMLRGVVRNITHFGAFVDVGVCKDGLILINHMRGQTLSIGQQIEVQVVKVEKELNRFLIRLVQVL